MIDVEDLIELVRNYNPKTNADQIRKAYAYGQQDASTASIAAQARHILPIPSRSRRS